MILVSVRTEHELVLAKRLSEAVAERFDTQVLCMQEPLCDAARALGLDATADAALCMLNPQRYAAVLTFSGTSPALGLDALCVVHYFDCVGIPTVEVQQQLFQPGFDAPGGPSLKLAGQAAPDVTSHAIASVARHALPFGGPDGIGYPGCIAGEFGPPHQGHTFVLLLTNLHDACFDAVLRYRLVFALLDLVAAQPALSFVWRPHPAEANHPESARLATLLADYDLPNFRRETQRSSEELLGSARAVVATLCNPLVAAAHAQTPCLVFDTGRQTAQLAALSAKGFRDGAELCSAFARLDAQPAEFLLHTTIPPLVPSTLIARLDAIVATRALRPGFMGVALEHARRVQPGFPPATDAALFELQSRELARIRDKLTVLQRSTLAYKAKRLAKRFGG
jgi:hypothetical protein